LTGDGAPYPEGLNGLPESLDIINWVSKEFDLPIAAPTGRKGNYRPKLCKPGISKNTQLQHDSTEKKKEMINNLETTRLERVVKRMREELEAFIEETPEQKRKRTKPEKKTNMKPGPRLKGAARPASSVGIYQSWVVPTLPPPTPTTNFFETHRGKFWDHLKTRKFLINLHNLAITYHKNYLDYQAAHPSDENQKSVSKKNKREKRTKET